MGTTIRVLGLAMVTILAVLIVAACSAGGAPPIPPTATPRPTATTEAVKPHRLRPRATPTTEEAQVEATPTEEASIDEPPTEEALVDATPTEDMVIDQPTEGPAADADITYTTYTSKKGDWSIDYPEGWQVSEDDPNTQFLEPAGEAFIQVTSSAMDSSNTNEDLVKLASDQFKTGFGDSYMETGQEKQSDGSYRIDFKFTVEKTRWDSQAFVEGRQSTLYMLLLATSQAENKPDLYDAIFTHVIGSYILPDK